MRNLDPKTALLVIDVQRDFCPGGALAVADGEAVVAPINALMPRFAHVLLTQDWHPPEHASFAAAHPGRAPYETIEMPYGPQTLWPVHCVRGSDGAAPHPALHADRARAVIRKGMNPGIDSYSAFFENDRRSPTGLAGLLGELGVDSVVCVGLALDYCVRYSAEDARRCGFAAAVLEPACRAIDLDGSAAAARAALRGAGVALLDTL